jgi:hypothetical protein
MHLEGDAYSTYSEEKWSIELNEIISQLTMAGVLVVPYREDMTPFYLK